MENGKSGGKIHIPEAVMQRMMKAAEGTFWDHLGCELMEVNSEGIKIRLDARKQHLNLIGIVHGGVTSSLLDNAMGMAAMLARPKDKVVTTNLNIHFVSPLKEGPLFVTAEVVHESNKIITATGRVTDEEGNLGTMGTGSFRVID